MRLSDRIRDELRDETGPCPTCGHARMTITGLAEQLGQPASSVGRYLAGGKPSVALLDAAESWLEERAAAVVDRVGGSDLMRSYEALPKEYPAP